jgi:hypothetical protein
MTRETGLSPRRALRRSRLPLSPRTNPGSPKTTPVPPATSAERRPTMQRDASLPHPRRAPSLSRSLTLGARLAAGIRLGPTARPSSARVPSCGLNRLRPSVAGSPDLNPRTRLRQSPRGSCTPGLSAPCQPANCRFRFGKKNCGANQFFSPNRNRSIPGEKTPDGLSANGG